jgi:hypothetical protein
MFCAVNEYLSPIVSLDAQAGLWLPKLVDRDILSGFGADLLLRGLTFNRLHLEWDEADEIRLAKSDFANGSFEFAHTHLSSTIEGIGRLWENRLAERHVAFDFDFPIHDFKGFYRDVTSLGKYIGVDSDIDALLGDVPIDDILA